jgi:hypothetical protein
MSMYDPASYPKGVPNPYGARVHAWNSGPYAQGTRYHGAVWTRPAYRLPWQRRPIAGLGVEGGSSLPWQCWDEPGFKECHGECWADAHAWCTSPQPDGRQWWQSSGGTLDDCITRNTDQRAFERCVPRYCAQYGENYRAGALINLRNPNLPWVLAAVAGAGLAGVAVYLRSKR